MQINKEFLKSLNPCADRYKHFLKHHGEFNGSFSEFMDLPNLDYEDKIWVAVIVLTKNQLVKWSILCAESVIHIFEANYPGNKSLSNCINCINYLKSINDFNNLTDAQSLEIKRHLGIIRDYCTAHANYAALAANHSTIAATLTAILTATHAATYASDAARSATVSARCATESADYAGEDAAKHSQQALNLQFLKQVISL